MFMIRIRFPESWLSGLNLSIGINGNICYAQFLDGEKFSIIMQSWQRFQIRNFCVPV